MHVPAVYEKCIDKNVRATVAGMSKCTYVAALLEVIALTGRNMCTTVVCWSARVGAIALDPGTVQQTK